MEAAGDPLSNQPNDHKCSAPDCARCQLLGRDRSVFVELFNKLDVDKDGLLNAAELRGLFRHLFGDTVSNEHLLHFENRYLLLYGESGCLSRDKFIAILEDFEKAHGYSMDEDAKELYAHFVTEQEPKIAPERLCNGIANNLPMELASKLSFFRDKLARGVKPGAEIDMETFVVAISAIFRSGDGKVNVNGSREYAAVPEATTMRHPFYRALLADRVARYEATERGAEPDRQIVDKLVLAINKTERHI